MDKKCFCYFDAYNPSCQVHSGASSLMADIERKESNMLNTPYLRSTFKEQRAHQSTDWPLAVVVLAIGALALGGGVWASCHALKALATALGAS